MHLQNPAQVRLLLVAGSGNAAERFVVRLRRTPMKGVEGKGRVVDMLMR